MRTALNVFRAKIPEPMRTILACRNPQTLEEAMNILFTSGYADYGGEHKNNNSNNRNLNRSRTDNSNGNYRDAQSNRNNNGGRHLYSNSHRGSHVNSTFYGNNPHNLIRPCNGSGFQRSGNQIGNNRNQNNYDRNNITTFSNQHQNPFPKPRIPEPMDINMIRDSHNTEYFQNIPLQQNCSGTNFTNNCPQSSYRYPCCNQPRAERGNDALVKISNSVNFSGQTGHPNYPNIVNYNMRSENFPFPATTDNYRI
ncbi:hypothetical protein FF38_01480 [Lucilia cuprina]|uniref:Uncharacterized protein n=1 Tax=Lucilia cuprina TaxID=7375 RepID=A0A0L0C263_LUCCU|nr:hypothetical protein FF38_01480 [Lucilia cuprina]